MASVILGSFLFVGCVGPISDPSHLMVVVPAPTGAPPTGKSEVFIHRPRNMQGYALYTGVWDSYHFVTDLGNGHSTAYVCDAGTHYFINRSVERVGVVEGNLLPDQAYDLWVDTAGAFIASFQLEPVMPGSKQQKMIPKWEREHVWVDRGPEANQYEQSRQKDIELILQDFVSGSKRDRLWHLAPEDHR
jgi:hypothetical protein